MAQGLKCKLWVDNYFIKIGIISIIKKNIYDHLIKLQLNATARNNLS